MAVNKHGIRILPKHPKTQPFDLEQVKPRHLQCTGKLRHRNRESALLHRNAAGTDFRAYNCPHCHYWHVGHSEETLVLSTSVKPA